MFSEDLRLLKPGKYKLLKLLLYTQNTVYDISKVFIELNLYEDLFSFSYTGNMILIETDNILGNEKILGGEKIEIEFEVVTSIDDSIEKLKVSLEGVIYKVSLEEPVTAGRGKSYLIDFICEENINNINTKISKSFVKKPIHDIVKFAYNQLSPKSKIKIESVRNILERVIIPNWNPYKTISWCAEKSLQTQSRLTGSYSSFLFYQTLYNKNDTRNREVTSYYHFVSIDSLLKKPSVLTIFYGIKDTYSFKVDPNKFLTAESFNVIENVDLLKLALQGGFTSRLIEYSFKNKTWKKKDFNYKNEFGKTFDSLEENPFLNKLNPFVNSNTPHVFFFKSYDENSKNYVKCIRNSQLSFLNNYKISLLLPGNGFISVGDIVTFYKPAFESDISNIANIDRTFSGKYMVTAVRHFFTPENYKMSIEIIKESLQEGAI